VKGSDRGLILGTNKTFDSNYCGKSTGSWGRDLKSEPSEYEDIMLPIKCLVYLTDIDHSDSVV
jgi:hypothetical protein